MTVPSWLPRLSRPEVIQQPQTGRTYSRPTSLRQYLLGETEEERKQREEEERQRKLFEAMRQREFSGDGFSEQTQTEFSGDGFSGPAQTANTSRLGAILKMQRDPARERQDAVERTDSQLLQMIQNAESLETPETKASDNRLDLRRQLAGRNQQALEGRLPGYQPQPLTPEEQNRVSRALMGDARGGMVDETSPLNFRLGAYQAAAANDRSAELQQQAMFDEMGRKQREIMSTRERDAQGNLVAPVESATSKTRPGNRKGSTITTIAEKMAGIEDDPSTPMDESMRYRAVWDGMDPEAIRRQRDQKVIARRKERTEQQAANRKEFQAAKAQQAADQQNLNILQRMMQLDNATGGQSHATSTWLQVMGGQKPPGDEQGLGMVKTLLEAGAGFKQVGDDDTANTLISRAMEIMGGGSSMTGQAGAQTLEDQAKQTEVTNAIANAQAAVTSGESSELAVQPLIDQIEKGNLTPEDAKAEAAKMGPDTQQVLDQYLRERAMGPLRQSIDRRNQRTLQGSVPGMRTF